MARRATTGLLAQYAKNAGGASASGYWLKFFNATYGVSTTPKTMYTQQAGGAGLAKCKLNTRGEPISSSGDDDSTFIPYVDGDYDAYIFFNEADADANNTINSIYLGTSVEPVEGLYTAGTVQFQTLSDAISGVAVDGTTIDFDLLTENGTIQPEITTVWNNSTSEAGGGKYLVANIDPGSLSSYVDGVLVGLNHDLGDGYYLKFTPKIDGVITLYQCGLSSASESANTAAIQAAIDSQYTVDFKLISPETYDSTVYINYQGAVLINKAGQYRVPLKYSGTGRSIHSRRAGTKMDGLYLQDSDLNKGSDGILLNNDTATQNQQSADIDAEIKNCILVGFSNPIRAVGRNAFIYDNLFGVFDDGIVLARKTIDEVTYPPADPSQSNITGFRGFDIQRNRFHASSGSCIVNNETGHEYLKKCTINSNNSDSSQGFFKGSLSESSCVGNIAAGVGANKIAFEMDKCESVTFDNQVSARVDAAGAPIDTALLTAYQFSQKAVAVDIKGAVNNCWASPVIFLRNVEGSTVDLKMKHPCRRNALALSTQAPILILDTDGDQAGIGVRAVKILGTFILDGTASDYLELVNSFGSGSADIDFEINISRNLDVRESNLTIDKNQQVETFGFQGDGAASQVFTLKSTPAVVIVFNNTGVSRFESFVAVRSGTTGGLPEAVISGNTLTVTGAANTNLVTYSVVCI